jgi:hypothetical protein
MIYSTTTLFDRDLNQVAWNLGDWTVGRALETAYQRGHEYTIANSVARKILRNNSLDETVRYIDIVIELREVATHELVEILANCTFERNWRGYANYSYELSAAR